MENIERQLQTFRASELKLLVQQLGLEGAKLNPPQYGDKLQMFTKLLNFFSFLQRCGCIVDCQPIIDRYLFTHVSVYLDFDRRFPFNFLDLLKSKYTTLAQEHSHSSEIQTVNVDFQVKSWKAGKVILLVAPYPESHLLSGKHYMTIGVMLNRLPHNARIILNNDVHGITDKKLDYFDLTPYSKRQYNFLTVEFKPSSTNHVFLNVKIN